MNSNNPKNIRERTLGEAAEKFFETLRSLEELNLCSKCGDFFLCRHKTCPECGESNPKYKEFTDEDQRRAENKVNAAAKEFHEVHRAT